MLNKFNREIIKQMFRFLIDIFLVLVVIPFVFIAVYFLPLFFAGQNRLALLRDLAELSFSMSWVSCAFLFIVGFSLKIMIRKEFRWYSLFACSYLSGALWLLLWNLIVEHTFTFWRSLFPLAFCCVVSTVYVLARFLYKDDSLNFAAEPQLDYHEAQEATENSEESDNTVEAEENTQEQEPPEL